MLYLFLIAFIISLPVAIPAVIIGLIIHFVNKEQRTKNNLYNVNGAQPPQYMGNCNMAPNVNGYGPQYMNAPTPGMVQQTAQPAMTAPEMNTFANGPVKSERQIRREKKRREREPMSSSTVMLLIGTALVVLSGIAFGAANWLSTSPLGRVCIICIASIVSFIISFIFMRAVKLKGTSSAFYMVGTMLIPVAVVIASFYDMLGNWLSFDGGGRFLLFAASFMMIAAGCFAGHRIYRSKHFVYSGLSMVSASLLFIALQTALIDNCTSMGIFASVLLIFQAVLTALIYVFRIHEKTAFADAVKLIGTITSVVYAVISLTYALSTFAEPVMGTFFILGLIIAQLIFYGIYKEQKWMLCTQSVVSVITALLLSIKSEDLEFLDVTASIILFIILSSVIFFANRFVPKLRNIFSVTVGLCSMFFGCAEALDCLGDGHKAIIISLSLLTSLIIYLYVFDQRKSVQIAAGIVSPFMPMIIAGNIRSLMFRENVTDYTAPTHLAFGTASLVLVAIAAVIMFIPKFAFGFHAKHPRKTDVVIYTNLAAAILLLTTGVRASEYIFIPLISLLAHFVTANFMKNNIMAVASGLLSCAYLEKLLDETLGLSDNALIAITFGCFLMLMAVSKIVYPKAVITKKDGRTIFDTALLSGWILIPFLCNWDRSGVFFVWLSMAIFTACFVKKNTKPDAASILLSIAAIFTAMALFDRPFLVPYNEMIANKITFAIIAMVGVAFRIIWRRHEKGAKISSNIVFVLTFAMLMIDGFYFEHPGNTVFILAVTTLILIISFMVKSKTWFSVSSIAIATIILYSSKGFLASLSGWVYLFAAGLILISIAAINEYYKQKGENVKSKLATVFSDWSW